jgi:hypothetical protein
VLSIADSDLVAVVREHGELVGKVLLFDLGLDSVLGKLVGRNGLEDEPALDEAVIGGEPS